MANNDDFLRFLASWALVHETADEGWKASVVRGDAQQTGDMDSGPEAFVDGLSAIIAERKERLKVELASGAVEGGSSRADTAENLDELRFEVSELRGRLESMQSSLDAILEHTRRVAGDAPGEA